MRVFLLLLTMVQCCLGATYYVDFNSGSDVAAGTSTGTAWKTIPGSRNKDDTDYQSTVWGPGAGTITISAKVQPGDTIKLKSGTTMTSNICGLVYITSDYYSSSATLANPITIMRDETWGSGTVTIDGNAMVMTIDFSGLFLIEIPGVVVNGGLDQGRRGIKFMRSYYNGISGFSLGSPIEGPNVFNCYFETNGTKYVGPEGDPAVSDATQAGIRLRKDYGPALIFNCEINGGSNYFQGICAGDSINKPCHMIVSNCIAYNHSGDNDAGIGMKGFGTNFTFLNCTNYFNYKGWDLGCKQASGSVVVYKIINSRSMSNHNGMNMNGPPHSIHPYPTPPKFYIINSLIHDNPEAGSRIYHGPMDFHCVGSLYYRNGGSVYGTGQLGITSDNSEPDYADMSPVTAHVYNTILYKPSSTYCNLFVEEYCPSNYYTLDSDFNSWTQTASEDAIYWGSLSSGACYDSSYNIQFSYGANGPGRVGSGNWFNWYAKDGTPPLIGGTGHFLCDPNSRGTGAIDTTPPPFVDPSILDFRLTNSFAGTNISGLPWYITEMGYDANGTNRASWDMGPLESGYVPPLNFPRGTPRLNGIRLKR